MKMNIWNFRGQTFFYHSIKLGAKNIVLDIRPNHPNRPDHADINVQISIYSRDLKNLAQTKEKEIYIYGRQMQNAKF